MGGERGRHGAGRPGDRPGEQPEAVTFAPVGAAREAPGERMLVVPGERLAGHHGLVPGDRRRRGRRGRHPAGRDQHPPGVVERGVVVGRPQPEGHVEWRGGVQRDLDRAAAQVRGDRARDPAAVAHARRAAPVGGDRHRGRQPRVGHQPGLGPATGRRPAETGGGVGGGGMPGGGGSVVTGAAHAVVAGWPAGLAARAARTARLRSRGWRGVRGKVCMVCPWAVSCPGTNDGRKRFVSPSGAARRGRGRGQPCPRSRWWPCGFRGASGRAGRRGTAARAGCA